eukprot:CAMPEP_0196594094 /NCGR_PEP_ID=MMETSP1081-20130531/77355_1 /TAXON_ID=36882 /ORGANISM="Pyramimonas amylifera, Strain CCMP720" /LENGTH=353 /DNA_ID=CAMNT_0041918257 /DNA_START=68 /DNA_END=1129 /DNA_ORIENTATION=-
MDGTIKFLVTLRTNLPEYRDCHKPIQVRRRFTDFQKIHKEFSSEAKASRDRGDSTELNCIPPFPPKALFMSDKVLFERSDLFTDLLKVVGQNPNWRVSSHIADFFQVKLCPRPAAPVLRRREEEVETEDGAVIGGRGCGGEEEEEEVQRIDPVLEPEEKFTRPQSPLTWVDNPLEELVAKVNAQKIVPEETPPPQPELPKCVIPASFKPKPRPPAPRPLPKDASTEEPDKPVASGFKAFSLNFQREQSLLEGGFNYPASGEGVREAIKTGKLEVVSQLLSKGVDVNFCDQQGMTLLHVAALFNMGDIASLLMDSGARTDTKNAQGETPIDIAPVSLASRMRRKTNSLALQRTC